MKLSNQIVSYVYHVELVSKKNERRDMREMQK